MFLIDNLGAAMRSSLEWYLGFLGPLLALTLLSLTVFVVMLPLYAFGDRLLARHKRHLARLQPELDTLAALSGSKKYFYTREIYRRYGYSPLHSLLGLFGLLVQLPFFLAAYRMLHDFAAFSGLSAWPFQDLGAADALLRFSGLQIHLAPLVMTLLNLLSAYYYAENRDDKKKIWLFPLLFLILLYKQPSALVFYWSMNNVFSLVKNLYLHSKRPDYSLRHSWWAIEELRPDYILRACYGVRGRLLHFALLCAGLLFAALYFFYTDSDKEIPSLWANFSIGLLFYLSIFYLIPHLHGKILPSPKRGAANRVVLRIVLGLGFASLLVYAVLLGFLLVLELRSSAAQELAELVVLRQQIQFLRPILMLCGLLSCLCMASPALGNKVKRSLHKRFALALSLCLLTVMLTVPVRVLASDPAEFVENGGHYGQLALWLLSLLLGLWLLLYGLYRFMPRFLQWYICFFAVLGGFFFSVNILLFPGKYGAMEFTSFKQPLQISNNAIAASALLVVVLLVSLYLLMQKKNARLLDSALCLLLVLQGVSLGSSLLRVGRYHWQSGKQSKEQSKEQSGPSVTAASTVQKNQIFFSRSRSNVVIVMLDKFMGGMVPEILRADPSLAERLSGFVYYPNTVSQAHLTYGGFHPIVGGSEYTVDRINSSKQDVASSIIEAFTLIPKALQTEGFHSYFLNVKYLLAPRARGAMQQSLAEAGVRELESSLDYSLLPNPSAVRHGSPKWQNFFVLLGAFQAFGPIFREKIYDDGRWLGLLGDEAMWAAIAFWEPYIQLLSLPRLVQAEVQTDSDPVYLLIHNHLPHNTRFANAEQYYGNPANFSFPLPDIPELLVREDARNGNRDLAMLFLSNYQSLQLVADWFDDLKAKGLYDNTQIFLVSDHGARAFDPSFHEQRKPDFPYKGNFHSLYMSKGLSAQGRLQSRSTFHTAADLPSELLPQLGVRQNPYTGQELQAVRTEPLPLYIVAGIERSEELTGNDYQIYTSSQYKLHNRNIFEPSNWEAVE